MKKITEIRKNKGISQAYLAKLTGISRYRISELECGYKEPSQEEKGLMLGALTNRQKMVLGKEKRGSCEK